MVEAARDERRLTVPARRLRELRRLDRCDAALAALDHATNEVRSLGRGLLAMVVDEEPLAPGERAALGDLLEAVVAGVQTWRLAVAAEDGPNNLDQLRSALDRATAELQSLRTGQWHSPLDPLRIALLLDIERIIGELDPDGAHAAAVTEPSSSGEEDGPGAPAESGSSRRGGRG
jgi:hypothetical protein